MSVPTEEPVLEAAGVDGPIVSCPAYSVCLISSRLQLPTDLSVPDDSDNLFPRWPHLTLWYAPYARQQPRFDIDGVYTVDLGPIRDESVAVMTMYLSALQLKADSRYQLAFEAKADQAAGFVTKLPGPGSTENDEQANVAFTPLGSQYRRIHSSFEYNPEINKGEITFVFPDTTSTKGERISFRSFSILATD